MTTRAKAYTLQEGETMKTTKKASDAQLRAIAKYDAANTKQIMLKLNRKTDADILGALEACGNVQGYIKKLIRADLAKK